MSALQFSDHVFTDSLVLPTVCHYVTWGLSYPTLVTQRVFKPFEEVPPVQDVSWAIYSGSHFEDISDRIGVALVFAYVNG